MAILSSYRSAFSLCDARARRTLAAAHRIGAVTATSHAWRELHRCIEARRPLRPSVQLLHISKSGGTSICAAAVHAGCRDARWAEYYPQDACKIRPRDERARVDNRWVHLTWDNCIAGHFDDGPRWIAGTAAAAFERWTRDRPSQRSRRRVHTCDLRAQWLARHRVTFHSIESALSDEMVRASACEAQMVGITVMRDPVERIQSHVHAVLAAGNRSHPLLARDRLLIHDGDRRGGVARAIYNVSYLSSLLPVIFDNAYVRFLAGDAAARVPFGAINASHLALALGVLHSLDFVLPLGSQHTGLVLERGLGWPRNATAQYMRSRYGSRPSVREAAFTIADAQWLAHLNRFDYALYGVAHSLHSLDALSLQQLDQHVHVPPHPDSLATTTRGAQAGEAYDASTCAPCAP